MPWVWFVVLGSGCICLPFSFMGLSFALTSLCFREELFLYAITGGSGKICRSVLLLRISFQCSLMISLSLLASSQNCVTKTNFFAVFFWLFSE